MKEKFVKFVPGEAEGKKIKAACFNSKAYLYVPNEETAQQAVWISRKQFTMILIIGSAAIGFMFISFFVISVIRYKASPRVEACSTSGESSP